MKYLLFFTTNYVVGMGSAALMFHDTGTPAERFVVGCVMLCLFCLNQIFLVKDDLR
jgi:hypothetical protein